MLKAAIAPSLTFPHPAPPQPGETIEVAPGLLWVRLALPYRLDHVNVYLIEDGEGFAVLDTGLDDAPTRAAWETLLAGALRGRPLSRIIIPTTSGSLVGSASVSASRC
jgi:glyoxylase-like metal-dependent hydrolase (beta-lactamase superfamily II)